MINVRREGVLLTNSEVHSLLQATLQQPQEKVRGVSPEQAALLKKAAESLHWAKQMARGGQYDFAASRAYYAMFSVAQLFLLDKGLSFSKHSAVIAAFGKHIAHPRIVPVEFHRYLIDAQEARLIGDYAPEAMLSESDGITLIAYADEFLEAAGRSFEE